ncbi:5-oxoprolinase subunit B family protein [Devosia aurantiaca]|uniref:Allophanate hydrolase subunit 1 n=1 Tax=Devosia aurantiaca TaxID=2714858 RepID=A0A6M1SLY6_9HYPH|nr:carboxyltransferase domain-containing protein [Devosia aurantiaca]NGP17556.1 allophanate hydrolase subunit 1 [Devosia aurantiaca]
MTQDRATIMPLGDSALLVRFSDTLDDEANRRAVSFAHALENDAIEHVLDVVPSLVSVLVRYDPRKANPTRLAGELSLRLRANPVVGDNHLHRIDVHFGGEDGPDLEDVASKLDLSTQAFVEHHNAASLRVLTTGFAPGFVYCGFHPEHMVVPRRASVRPLVTAGSILFAAGQTAIAATDIPTGWHVIGRTSFRNFDPARMPPTSLRVGDLVEFVSAG